MNKRASQCGKCGHFFSDENPYFSEDFAAYFSKNPMFLLTWCFHCSYISVRKRPWYFSVIGLPALKYESSFTFDEFLRNSISRTDAYGMSGIAAAHLFRMIWNCLNSRINLEFGVADHEKALHLAIDKLPPFVVAFMIVMTVNARVTVPLEQQIQEGNYIQDSIDITEFNNWISTYKNKETVEIVLKELEKITKTRETTYSGK